MPVSVLDTIGILTRPPRACGKVILKVAKLALAAAFAAAATGLSFGQANWQIDSAHSTASLSLVSSNNATRNFNIAIAKAAGSLNLNENKPTESSLRLSIYPAGQDSSLLNPDGSFRKGGLANLSRYTLMSFQSTRAVVTADRKIEFTGDLTIAHVQRETAVAWNNAYTGSVPTEPVVNAMTVEVTFIADLSNLPASPTQWIRTREMAVQATVQRHDLPGFFSALKDSNWPLVVLDEECQMPYYPALTSRDYHGAACTGTLIEPATYTELPYYPVAANTGAGRSVPPSGDQITILVHLHLERENSKTSATHN